MIVIRFSGVLYATAQNTILYKAWRVTALGNQIVDVAAVWEKGQVPQTRGKEIGSLGMFSPTVESVTN